MSGVLVTGAGGFLGTAVCRAAVTEGAGATGLVRPGEAATPLGGVTYREVDWSDTTEVGAVLRQVAPERVVHCAGATPRLRISTAELYDANTALVWRLLNLVKTEAAGAGVVVVSSAAVYGPNPKAPITEEEPLNPVTHYAWSKMLAEQAARAFADTDGIRVCIARPFNLIGAGEPRGSIVSDVVEQIEAGADVIRVRETSSVRDFIDVDDAARALLLLAERGEPGQAYNVCSGVGVSVAELIEMIQRVWGAKAQVFPARVTSAGTVSLGSCDKLSGLGWVTDRSLMSSLGAIKASMDT